MPSTYTQNLGVELPATGEQANIWGLTVNRNMDTLDKAINGNVQLTLSTSPYSLTTGDGAALPVAANPLIIWTGPQAAQGSVQIDWQSNRQHLYIMSNQTSNGFPIAFAQGSGSQFVLQAGYDAIIYTDGGSASASVAAALNNPQFHNVLVTGDLLVEGSLNGIDFSTFLTPDAQGNLHLTAGLGVNDPASIPDPLTVGGLGTGGQLRLVQGNYGVVFRNDGTQLMVGVTASGDPYGGVAAWPVATTLVNQRTYFNGTDPYVIGLQNGANANFIGTTPSGQLQLSNAGGQALLVMNVGGAAFSGTLTTGGQIHVVSGGIMFPDGTVQTTAGGGGGGGAFPGNVSIAGGLTVGDTARIGTTLFVGGQCMLGAPSSVSLSLLVNHQITFVMVTNTELLIVGRGGDGITRQVALTLA